MYILRIYFRCSFTTPCEIMPVLPMKMIRQNEIVDSKEESNIELTSEFTPTDINWGWGAKLGVNEIPYISILISKSKYIIWMQIIIPYKKSRTAQRLYT